MTVISPVSESVVLVSVSAEVSLPAEMTGESLVPVMVMATEVVLVSELASPLSSWRETV